MSYDVTLFWDYVVLGFCIFLNSSVVLYMKFFGPKQHTKKDYVFASDTVSIPAMILSITRGTLGIRAFLGYPAELFYKSSAMWEIIYGMVLAYIIVCFVFAPVYMSLGITSIYQYLDLRFKSSLVRCLASATYIIRQLLLLSITIYTPSVALKTILGIPQWVSIVTLTSVGIFFGLLGGFQAAIYADVIQVLMMIGMSFAIIIKGTLEAGGMQTVYKRNVDGNRLNFFNFDFDPTIRVTTISAMFGQLFISLSTYGCAQNFVQRYFSIKSKSKLTKTLLLNVPVTIILFSLTWIVGMIIYANYYNCDPFTAGKIKKYDEILPFYIEDKFHYLPGILGLFLACLFNGALCLNASNLNSLSTVIFEDFIKNRIAPRTEIQQIYAIKTISVICGLLVMGISFVVELLSGIIETSITFSSATSGPLLGVFTLAMLVPCCNWKGAAFGMILGHFFCIWIVSGGLTIDKPIYTLNLTTSGCDNNTFKSQVINLYEQLQVNYTSVSEKIATPNNGFLHYIYSVTFMYYAVIGFTITVIFGTLISICTGSNKKNAFDVKLLHPVIRRIVIFFEDRKRTKNDLQE